MLNKLIVVNLAISTESDAWETPLVPIYNLHFTLHFLAGCCQKPRVELFRTSGLVCPNDTSVFVCITSGVNLIWMINNDTIQTYNSPDDTVGTLSIYSNNNNHIPPDMTVFVVLARADAKGQYSDCSSFLGIKPSAYILDTLEVSCMAQGQRTTAMEIFNYTTGEILSLYMTHKGTGHMHKFVL